MTNVPGQIAGTPIVELARRFGTPLYVYNAAVIRRRLAELADFDVVRYAQKACSNLSILDLVRRAGAMVDAVSAGEIRRALAAGYKPQGDPPPIVFTADVFTAESLALCVEHGVHVNCGSPEMIDQFGATEPGGEITLRINPGFGHGATRKTNTGGDCSKHGIWHEQLGECLARAARYNLRVSGLHMHIGSGTDLEHLALVCGAMERMVAAAGPDIRNISAGGGLPVVYRPDDRPLDLPAYFTLWNAARKRMEQKLGRPLRLEIEPGRFVVAESGTLVAEIRAVKRQGENLFYLLDAGFNNLARPILYGAYHPMSVVPADGDYSRPLVEAIVGGPLCESGDVFTQEEGGVVVSRRLLEARVGDFMAIGNAGAYGFAMGSNYNSQPLAAEVLIDGGAARLIRRRQTFEDMIRGEQLPAE
jgi:diaminopimelate decarboxylase